MELCATACLENWRAFINGPLVDQRFLPENLWQRS